MKGRDRVIFWDFHGTLASSPRLWSGSMKAVLDENEPDNDVTLDALAMFVNGSYTWDLPDRSYADLVNPRKWWAYHEELFEKAYVGNGLPPEKARKYALMVRDQIIRPERYELFDDTIIALQASKDAGNINYILSNHIPELPMIATSLGLSDLVDECFTSAIIGFVKPNENAFKEALRMTGNPENAWMIGDDLKADVLGATQANLNCILVHSTRGDHTGFYSKDLIGVLDILYTN
jgi:putative hydrolase of the HAD superfamily